MVIVAAIFFVPSAGMAQSERVRLSSAEEIAIAFYHTANIVPNFRHWIWHRDPYKRSPAAHRSRVFDEEMLRLQTAYQTFNKRRDLLMLRFPVDIKPRQEKDAYYLGMTLKGLDQAHYLSYRFMEEQIAVFPFGMDVVMDSRIDKRLYDRLVAMDQERAQPVLLAAMEAKQANADRPYNIDGLQQWVFKTKIETMTLYTQEGDVLWEYTAPLDLKLNN
jgi:hypothetical protein